MPTYIQNKYPTSVWGDFIGWSVSTVSQKRTITTPLTLTVKDAGRQVISSATTQDVILPDATTLNDAFESLGTSYAGREFTIQAVSANLTVKNSAGTVLGTVLSGRACTFTLVDASTAAGEWYVCCCGTPPPYVVDFVVADFTLVGSGTESRYEYTVPASTHLMGLNAEIAVRDTSGFEIFPDQKVDPTTGDVTIAVSDVPDGRFAGRLIIRS